VSKKKSPTQFSEIFPKGLGIFNQFFTHLLYDPFYTRLQIFIEISPTLTKLCHTSATTQRIFTFHYHNHNHNHNNNNTTTTNYTFPSLII